MADAGQTDDPVRVFGEWTYPRLVGALVVAGASVEEADAHVRHVVRRELKGGLQGGTEFGAILTEAVLQHARPPALAVTTASPMSRSLAGLPWKDRMATVASLGLDCSALGAGKPEVVRGALPGVGAEPGAVMREAIEEAAPRGNPDLIERMQRDLRRRRAAVALAGLVVVVAIAVVAVVLIARHGDDPAAARPTTTADYHINQWVAVLGYGPDAFGLYPQVEELGRVVGVYVFTDRWDCYEGLPDRRVSEDDDWFLGLAAQDKERLDELLAATGRSALVEARVRQVCLPPPP